LDCKRRLGKSQTEVSGRCHQRGIMPVTATPEPRAPGEPSVDDLLSACRSVRLSDRRMTTRASAMRIGEISYPIVGQVCHLRFLMPGYDRIGRPPRRSSSILFSPIGPGSDRAGLRCPDPHPQL